MSTHNISKLPPIPPSPVQSFASTAYPTSNIGVVPPPPPLPKHFLSRADVSSSISAYETLSDAVKAYRKAMSAVASTASAFGAALETCARCKGAGETADGLMNAGGLQYLIASNIHILSESLYRGFEVALLHELDSYKEKNAENEERYKKEAREMNKELRKREQQHLKLSRQKTRNLTTFRSVLVDLTEQIDSLETLRYSHYRASYELSQDTSLHVLDSIALVVRAEIEVFDKISQKGWEESGGLRNLIDRSADPFAPTSGVGSNPDGEIFSILPTASILPSPHGALSRTGSESGAGGSPAHDSTYQSLSGAVTQGDYDDYEDDDDQSIFSGGFTISGQSKSRMAMPTHGASSAEWGTGDGNADGRETDILLSETNHADQGTSQIGANEAGWESTDNGDSASTIK